MISKKFGRKTKSKNNTGRATQVTCIMISRDLKNRLAELKDAYEGCYDVTVTYDQLLGRWADNVGRFDAKVVTYLEEMKKIRRENNDRAAAGLGLTVEQMEANKASYDPADPENEPWCAKYYFCRDGEEIEAEIGGDNDNGNFYAELDGKKVFMETLVLQGWTLINDTGAELDINQAWQIIEVIKQHENDNKSRRLG